MLIAEDNSVRLLSQVIEKLNYKELYKAYSTKGRDPAVEGNDKYIDFIRWLIIFYCLRKYKIFNSEKLMKYSLRELLYEK